MQIFQESQFVVAPNTGPASGWAPGTTVDTNLRDALLLEYWGGSKRKMFLCSDTELQALLQQSSEHKILVVGKNVDSPSQVELSWHAYEPARASGVDNYYVIEASFFTGENPADVPNGILGAEGDTTGATVGKKGESYFLLINRIKYELTGQGGINGMPPGVGVKIPID